jgi:AraC family transcriptional regulator, arabinose operon regulatory protein
MYYSTMNHQAAELKSNRVRALDSFSPFPEFPGMPAAQLDHLLSLVRIQPVSALEWDWPRKWSVGPRVVHDSMWFWFDRGRAEAWIHDPGKPFEVVAGDLVLIPQGARHTVTALPGCEAHVYAVHFYATLYGGINLLDLIGFPFLLPQRGRALYGKVSRELTREFAVKGPGWEPSMRNQIYSLLLNTIRQEGKLFHSSSNLSGDPNFLRLFPVIQRIDERLGDSRLSVKELAEEVYLSETHFRRIFQDVFATSPIAYLRQRRIDRACALLRTTSLSVKEIAQRCGFNDISFFSRVFHHLAGSTPANYRRMSLVE